MAEPPSNPFEISPGIIAGELGEEAHWYLVNLTGNYEFSLTASNQSTDFDMRIYSLDMTLVGSATRSSYPDVAFLYSFYEACYVEIYSFLGNGSYSLNISSFPVIPGDHYRNPIQANIGNHSAVLPDSRELWYNTTLQDNTVLRLSSPTESSVGLIVYSSDLEQIARDTFGLSPRELQFFSTNRSVLIKIVSSQVGEAFTLEISSFPKIQGDYHNNAIQFTEGMYNGSMPGPSEADSDWYILEAAGIYRVILQGSDLSDFDLRLYDIALNQIQSSSSSSFPQIMTTTTLDGTYFLEVYAHSGQGWYTLELDEIGAEAGHDYETPLDIVPGSITGQLPGPSVNFGLWMRIQLNGNYSISLNSPDGLDLDMILYDSLLRQFDVMNGVDNPEIMEYIGLNGTYYLYLYSVRNAWGDFTLEITEILPPVPTDTLDNGQRGDPLSYLPLFLVLGIGLIGTAGFLYRRKRLVGKAPSLKLNSKKDYSDSDIDSRKIIQSIQCRTCGELNDKISVFCGECGTGLV